MAYHEEIAHHVWIAMRMKLSSSNKRLGGVYPGYQFVKSNEKERFPQSVG